MNETKVFSIELTARPSDIDELGHVNNVVYVRWVQEMATAHWMTIASGELKRKYSWVVLRHEIDYKAPVFLNDKVIGTTWVGEHQGAKFVRFVRLSLNGKVAAEAKTIWCLLDSSTFRPLRIPTDVLEIL
ncbi:acyl-CoA thioesterase [Chryseosolibacter indicus]|uniref:Acyl-CoA thioesterase n=1 Tax=Chryseosolibacter indicus TaxID=2782351 RepID=A0ABS5VKR0_9BACT|nr:thioesterase family protein [Chryseosolibacter indicus]MBT1701681.1 acyl-CoA thioesterase [Chryseosolibacter indicus]